MIQSEPSRQWQEQRYQRILRKDPTAFAELCEQALPHLTSFLRAQFPHFDAHMHESMAIDCLLDFHTRPRQFDPGRLSLFAYLRMASRRDMLNAIDKKRRREQRLHSLDDPTAHLQLSDQERLQEQSELDEWLQQHTDLSIQEILESLDNELTSTDEQVLMLVLEGVRDSARFAQVLGITHKDDREQRKDVKRAKDRLAKKLRRFGQRIDRN
jgi:DNA-directed RNA polymerase specialized sigma24 family protein